MNSVVRALRDEDLPAAIDILVAGALGDTDDDANHAEWYVPAVAATRAEGGEILVVELDGDVVGVCQVIVFTHLQHRGGKCAEVESVHVRADWRSRGFGEQLMRAAESWARDRGCYRLQLTSNLARVDAHRFYERLGYSATHKGFKKSLR